MLKQYLQWKSPTGKPMQKTFYFHLTAFEVGHDMELEVLEARLKKFQEEVIGSDPDNIRAMTPPETREMLDIVRILVKHAYGVLEMGPDGEEFNKEDPDIWRRFVATGAFDAFIRYLFQDAARADMFMNNVWPTELQEAAQKEKALNERPDIRIVEDVPLPGMPEDVLDDDIPSIGEPLQPAWVKDIDRREKEWYDYSEEELIEMDNTKFQTLYAESSRGKNVPPIMLVVRQKRKQQEGATE